MSDLENRLLQAHANGDTTALIDLYQEAADAASADDAKGFYLTHAYVFALETGSPKANQIRDRLILMGREVPTG
ncbi:MAG: hypothetical protein ACR2O2_04225 [Ruegeria sp.]